MEMLFMSFWEAIYLIVSHDTAGFDNPLVSCPNDNQFVLGLYGHIFDNQIIFINEWVCTLIVS